MADEETTEVKKGKGISGPKSPFIVFLLLINMAAMGTIAFFQFQFMRDQASRPSISDLVKQELNEGSVEARKELSDKKVIDEGKAMSLDGFTVNLAKGDGPRRFVRLNAVLKFSSESIEKEFQSRKPQIRDTIIGILNSKRPKDLLKREGKEYLKEEIKAAINSFLVDGKVLDVYYVGFQIN
jgi:flagellar FliL protein